MSIAWNGIDLSATYGFSLIGEGQMERGLLSLPGFAVQEAHIPGRVASDLTLVRRTARAVRFDCGLFADTHDELLASRDAFVDLVGSGAFGALTVPDRADKRLLVATVEGLDLSRPDTAWTQAFVRFNWALRSRIPYWEDASVQTANPVVSPRTNDGDEACPVTWTCTVTGTLGSGLWFEVGSERFTYTGALAVSDVLVVETELPSVTKNGVADWANTATSAVFPWLQVGANTITKSSSSFTLRADYRRWWR